MAINLSHRPGYRAVLCYICRSLFVTREEVKILMKKLVMFILFVGLFTGCAKEHISPMAEARSFNEQRGHQPMTASFSIDNQEIDRFGDEIGDVPVVGGVFQEIARAYADIQLDEDSGAEVPIEPYLITLPELDDVDLSVVSSLGIESVRLHISDEITDDRASLDFIKAIEVTVSYDKEIIDRLPVPDAGVEDPLNSHFRQSVVALSYNKDTDEESLGCLKRCIDLKINNINWKKILEQNRTFIVNIKLVVGQVPPDMALKFGGEVKVFAHPNLPL